MTHERTTTTAERYLRTVAGHLGPEVEDLCVLALERAFLRSRQQFEVVPSNWKADTPLSKALVVLGSAPAGPRDIVGIRGVGIPAKCAHVADWLAASLKEDAPWLRRVDDAGRPLKLMKIGSLDRAVREADKDMLRRAARTASTELLDGDEEILVPLDDGWSLVRLTTPRALDLESGRMRHCIGQGAYDDALANGTAMFLSLRDARGRPHATLEIATPGNDLPKLVQYQGKQNERPVERHLRRMRTWLMQNVDARKPNEDLESWTRYARTVDGTTVDLCDPPVRIDLAQRIHLRLAEGDVLPTEVLTSTGSIHLTIEKGRKSPVVLPSELRCHDAVVLQGPGTFVFGRSFSAHKLQAVACRLEAVPDDLDIEFTTILEDCVVDVLPARAGITRLVLKDSTFRLPEGFRAYGLDLTECVVGELPSDLIVETLSVGPRTTAVIPDGCRIETLSVVGDGLRRIGRVDGLKTLILTDVSHELELPDDLSLGERLLVMGPGRPDRLPDDLRVATELSISGVRDMRLPSGLDVGNLTLSGKSVDALPDGTRIRGFLRLTEHDGLDVGLGCEIGNIRVDRSLPPGRITERSKWILEPSGPISRIETGENAEPYLVHRTSRSRS